MKQQHILLFREQRWPGQSPEERKVRPRLRTRPERQSNLWKRTWPIIITQIIFHQPIQEMPILIKPNIFILSVLKIWPEMWRRNRQLSPPCPMARAAGTLFRQGFTTERQIVQLIQIQMLAYPARPQPLAPIRPPLPGKRIIPRKTSIPETKTKAKAILSWNTGHRPEIIPNRPACIIIRPTTQLF